MSFIGLNNISKVDKNHVDKNHVDKNHVAQRFAKAAANYDENALVQQQINQQLIEILAQKNIKNIVNLLEIGCGTGGLTKLLQQNLNVNNWFLNDLNDYSHRFLQILGKTKFQNKFHYFTGDAESLDFTNVGYDLIIAGSSLQWFNQPQLFLHKASKLLSTGGWLVFSVFGAENLHQIKSITGKGLHYPSKLEWQQWLETNFQQIELLEQRIDLLFNSPQEVLAHLKNTGVGATNKQAWTKKDLQLFIQQYQQFKQQQQYVLTYHPLIITAKKHS